MSRSWVRIVLIIVLVAAALLLIRLHVAAAQTSGAAAAGRRLAQAWCMECHSGSRAVASAFTDIANLPSTTALSLRAFLRSSHRAMPNLVIADSDADDLVAYILSLKRK